ncbi:MAG: N-6 DNA methylase [Sphingomonas bacterium]
MSEKKHARLEAKIDILKGLRSSEADVSNHLRDLLTDKLFGIGLKAAQIQVDTANLPGSRRRPDLAIFSTENGQPVCTVDNMVAVIEMKRSNTLTAKLETVLAEKREYIQPATRYFYLIDQMGIWRYDVVDQADAKSWTWDQLKDPNIFGAAFGVISAAELRFEEQLERFQQGRTRYAHLSIAQYKKPAFIRTISEVSETLQSAIESLIDEKVTSDLRQANALLESMEVKWGAAVIDWAARTRPIEFSKAVDDRAPLSDIEIGAYEDDHDQFAIDLKPYFYALEIERNLLARYAERLALDQPSLLGDRTKNGKPTASGRAIANLAYETGALIMSRMLMVRFSEDHGLFTTRYISNGGIHIFSEYARHFKRKMQALLKETNRASAQLFAHLFDENLLDWALDRDDETLSHAILKSAYLLSRWDFKTAHGDILSGVYDKYLDTSRRRALGEVYTRPEVARYMLKLAGVGPNTTVLDPACGTGTFLVESLVSEIERLRVMGLHRDVGALRAALSRFAGLDINDFAIVLAQIQIIWHLIEVLAGSSAEEVRIAARTLIPAIALAGGWSSLHPMGLAFGTISADGPSEAAQATLHYDARQGEGRRTAELTVPRKFLRLARGSYDVVVANPPYIRTHRQGGADYRSAYPEVAFGVIDIFVYFIYRALRQWVKPGGKLAVIVPIAVMDSDYASLLRKVIREHRVTHVVDLEALGKHTFHGIKRNTVILVIERAPPEPDDTVAMITVPPEAYDEAGDIIDFDCATEERIPLAQLSQEAFLPSRASMMPWVDTIERCEGASAPLLPKLKVADLEVLEVLAAAPRLGSIIKTAWTRRAKGETMRVAEKVPHGENPRLWRHEMVAGVGLELGGRAAFAPQGADIWKGQNIFPGNVEGSPVANGKWDPSISRPKSPKIYQYAPPIRSIEAICCTRYCPASNGVLGTIKRRVSEFRRYGPASRRLAA